MAFTKDDKDYLGLLINPIKDGLSDLNKKFKDHDEQTQRINDTQQQMLGAWNTVKYMILPILVGIIVSTVTWLITK